MFCVQEMRWNLTPITTELNSATGSYTTPCLYQILTRTSCQLCIELEMVQFSNVVSQGLFQLGCLGMAADVHDKLVVGKASSITGKSEEELWPKLELLPAFAKVPPSSIGWAIFRLSDTSGNWHMYPFKMAYLAGFWAKTGADSMVRKCRAKEVSPPPSSARSAPRTLRTWWLAPWADAAARNRSPRSEGRLFVFREDARRRNYTNPSRAT